MKFTVIVGSVRSDRQGIKAARFVERTLAARAHEVVLVDPVEVRLPLLDGMYSAGAFGGVRAVMQLRAMLAELGMPSISSIFAIPRIGQALTDAAESPDPAFGRRFARFATELEWYAGALHEARKKGLPY